MRSADDLIEVVVDESAVIGRYNVMKRAALM